MEKQYNLYNLEPLFNNYLSAVNISPISIKNYLSDYRHFAGWFELNIKSRKIKKPSTTISDLFQLITPEAILSYQQYLINHQLPLKTVNRRLSTIRKFCSFGINQGWIKENPAKKISNINLKNSSLSPNSYPLTPNSTASKSPELIKKVIKWCRTRVGKRETENRITPISNIKLPNSLPISSFQLQHYIGFLILFLFISVMGAGIYNQFFIKQEKSFAYSSAPTRAGRLLSFQGRLTDSLGYPINTATNVTFSLYNEASGGSPLYTAGACSITPDSDGIINVLIGGAGYTPTPPTSTYNVVCGSEVDASIFSENANVYLGITVASDLEMTPRQQIANVGYAINSETLQGLPPGSNPSSIPYINSDGNLLIAASSPGIRSTFDSTAFTISSAQSTVIQSAGAGDVILQATESGTLKFRTGGSSDTYLRMIIDNDGKVGIGDSTPDHTLDVAGNIGMDAGSYLNFGDTDGSSGYGIRDNAGTVEFKNSGGSWTGIGNGSGDSYWSINEGALYPINTSLDLLIGANASSSAKFAFLNVNSGNPTASISGNLSLISPTGADPATTYNILNGGKFDLMTSVGGDAGLTSRLTVLNNGNVGIGDTSPASLLTVGLGDLFQVNSSGIIAAIDNVAHTIDDVGGNLSLTSNSTQVDIADDLGVNGATSADITTTTAAATVFNTTATTLSLGGAATTLNLGTTDSVTRTINLGTGTGVDTINIGNGGTGADVINLGSANAGNVTIRSNAALGLTGSTGSFLTFPNFAVSTDGIITKIDNVAHTIDDVSGNLTLTSNSGIVSTVGDLYVSSGISLYNTVVSDDTIEAAKFCTGDGETNCVTDFSSLSGSASIWTDGGTYIYPTNGEVLGNSTSAGANKLAGLYLADSAPLYFGTDNDINFTFSGSTLAITQGDNDINFDSNTLFIDGSANNVGIGTNTPAAKLHIAGAPILGTTRFGYYGTAGASRWTKFATIPIGGSYQNNHFEFLIHNRTGSVTLYVEVASGATYNTVSVEQFYISNNWSNGISASDFKIGRVDTGSQLNYDIWIATGSWSNLSFQTRKYSTYTGLPGITYYNATYSSSDGADDPVASGYDATISVNETWNNPGNVIFGDASSDTVTSNANAWTFVNDTNFVLSGGVNGLSFDTTTFSIDASNDRVGIGDTTPAALLTVGSGDLFQVNSSGIIAAIDGVAHTIDDVSGNLTLTSNSNTISLNDNVTFAGTTTLNGVTYTWPGSDGSDGHVLKTNGSGTLSWVAQSGGGDSYWSINEGALYPINTSLDLLIGANASSSAKFAFLNVNSGNPTASISGNLSLISPTGADPATTYNILNGGKFDLMTSVGGDAGLTSRLTVLNNGNVGIGNTNPSSKLDIGGATSTISNASGDITIDAASDNISFNGDNIINFAQSLGSLGSSSAPTYSFSGDENTGFYSPDANTLALSTDGTERFTIGSTGNVGIGDGSPSSLLTVGSGDLFQIDSSGRIAAIDGVAHTIDDVSGALTITPNAGASLKVALSTTGDFVVNTDDFYIDTSAGVVGINTSSPSSSYRLTVNGDMQASTYYDLDTPTFYMNPAGASNLGGNITMAGDISMTDGSPSIASTSNASITINAGSGSVLIGAAGAGKLDAGTIDPPYTINNKKYATYYSAMTGVKEETTGTIVTNEKIPGIGYRAVINFDHLTEGSDLWLFSKTSNLRNNIDKLVVLTTPKDNTRSWYVFDKEKYQLQFFSSKPTTISYRLTAPRFDYSNWKNTRTTAHAGFVINDQGNLDPPDNTPPSQPVYTIVNDNNPVYEGDIETFRTDNQLFEIIGDLVEEIIAVNQGVFATIKSGFIEAENLIINGTTVVNQVFTNTLTSVNASIDNLVVKDKIISPVVETENLTVTNEAKINKIKINEIGSDNQDIIIQLNQSESDKTDSFDSGTDLINQTPNKGTLAKLIIKGLEGKTVTTIDSQGNVYTEGDVNARSASFSGQIIADSLSIDSDATISGTLIADNIKSKNINSLEEQIASQSSLIANNYSLVTSDINEIQSLLANIQNQPSINPETQTDLSTITDLTDSSTGLINQTLTFDQLTVTGQSNLYNVSVGGSLLVGTTLMENNQILSLAPELKINSLSTVNFFDGAVTIAKDGTMTTTGELIAKNGIKTNEINPLTDDGQVIINNLVTNNLTISDKYLDATQSGAVIAAPDNFEQNGIFAPAIDTATTSAGLAILPENSQEVIIYNNNVKNDSLIYLTPTNSTINSQLSVISKYTCPADSIDCKSYFKVGTNTPITLPIKFNWLLIN